LKQIRSYGGVEKRSHGKWRARTGRADGWKTIGHFDTKEQAEQALEDYKTKNGIDVDESKEDTVGQASKPFVEVSKDQVEISTGVVEKPITNWDSILESFGLDPEVFEIADDKVRMSKWQSSKRLENGDRDQIWLYSYKALFTRRKKPKISDKDVEEIRSSIRNWKPTSKSNSNEIPSTFVILWSDWQLYKSASGGIKATMERVQESFDKTYKRINELKKLGRNIEQIAFVNLGDPVENCDGHYSTQLFTVEGTLRQQLLTALDLWVSGVTTLSGLAPKRKFISVLSNHGEWNRRNGKQITSDSDSSDGFLADALQRILDGKGHIDEWHIPHDEMSIQVNLSGQECAFHHGHKITGKELEWLRGQSLRLLRENNAEPRIWFTGHKHHINVTDLGFATRIQAPSLDSDGSPSGGSKWYTDSSALWSSPGTCTLLIGNHDKRGWSDLAVL